MKSTIRSIFAGGLLLGATVLAAPDAAAQGKGQKDHDKREKVQKVENKIQKSNKQTTRTTARRVNRTARTRVLCEDGTWGYRGTSACANNGGIASRQGNYGTTPRASARARERANENSAVARMPYANTNSVGAIARCTDGTYWHANTRTNACYRHGGVAYWL